MSKSLSETKQMGAGEAPIAQLSRRKFLGYASAATGLMVVASACSKEQVMDTNNVQNNTITAEGTVDLGTGDIGILNYAYALEQLEAAFYTLVVSKPYNNISPMELSLLTDIRDHEISHREFFKNALGGMAIPALDFDWSSITFSSRDSVLGTAKAFEDLGVSAYNGAGRLIMSADYLVLAGKIVSVEARHAAAVRDLISNGTFADGTTVDAMGLDATRKPLEVLAIAGTYIKTKIDASHLPTY
ncbi:MAG: ferritin-like domain-containing protein [Chitinophagaceae bacterium]